MPKDVNAEPSATLRELASAQTVTFKARMFRRAAAAVLALDRPIDQWLGSQGLPPDIAGIGPASWKVIVDVLRGVGFNQSIVTSQAEGRPVEPGAIAPGGCVAGVACLFTEPPRTPGREPP